MNIAIVDDIASEREAVKSLLLEYAAKNSLKVSFDEFSSGENFLSMPLNRNARRFTRIRYSWHSRESLR